MLGSGIAVNAIGSGKISETIPASEADGFKISFVIHTQATTQNTIETSQAFNLIWAIETNHYCAPDTSICTVYLPQTLKLSLDRKDYFDESVFCAGSSIFFNANAFDVRTCRQIIQKEKLPVQEV